MVEKIFNSGEVIFHQGEVGRTFFKIQKGVVGIFVNYGEKDEMKLTELKDDTKVKEYDETEMNEFLKDPENGMTMIDYLGERLRTLTEDYKEVCAVIDDCTTIVKSAKNMTLDQKVKKHVTFFRSHKALVTKSVEKLREENGASKYESRVKNIE